MSRPRTEPRRSRTAPPREGDNLSINPAKPSRHSPPPLATTPSVWYLGAEVPEDFIQYEGAGETFPDFDIWVLHHFFLVEAKAMEIDQWRLDVVELRKFL